MFRNPVTDVIVVLVIALLIFGPKRLPLLGRSLGQGLKEFKDSITGDSHDGGAEERPALNSASSTEPVAPSAAPERESADVGSSEGRA